MSEDRQVTVDPLFAAGIERALTTLRDELTEIRWPPGAKVGVREGEFLFQPPEEVVLEVAAGLHAIVEMMQGMRGL